MVIPLLVALLVGPASAPAAEFALASRPTAAAQSNGNSYHASVSADGRFVAFQSDASNLAADDRNEDYDIFVRDMERGSTHLATPRAGGGATAAGRSTWPAMSGNARFVAYQSFAADLVPGDRNRAADIFVRDLRTGRTRRIGGNGGSFDPAISADGRVVAFQSFADDLTPGDRSRGPDVFARDMRTGATDRISPSGGADNPSLSPDGRWVAFEATGRVLLHDRRTGRTTLVSGRGSSYQPSVSATGRFVAFVARSAGREDIFVRDLRRRVTHLVTARRPGARTGRTIYPSLSADGRWVAFHSDDSNLVAGDVNDEGDVFLRDLRGRTTRIASRRASEAANGYSGGPVMTPDARFAVFASEATNLVADDHNAHADVFRATLR